MILSAMGSQDIELFQNLIYVSVAIAVVGLGLAIFFYFFFDIPNVYALMTGKAKRQTIERMAQQNSRTGRMNPITGTIRDPNIPLIQHPADVRTAEINPTQQIANTNPSYIAQETQVLEEDTQTSVLVGDETSVLSAGETSVLSSTAEPELTGETSILGAQEPLSGETAVLAPAHGVQAEPVYKPRFDITENTLVIHTNEIL